MFTSTSFLIHKLETRKIFHGAVVVKYDKSLQHLLLAFSWKNNKKERKNNNERSYSYQNFLIKRIIKTFKSSM